MSGSPLALPSLGRDEQHQLKVAAILAAHQRLTAPALAAVVASSVIVAIFDPDIDLVAEIPEGLPSIGLPSGISASDWLTLVLGGCVVALVGFSEGWGASKQIAKKTHDDLDTNQEFRAYGAGNIGAGLLGGMVVTGSLSKSSAAEEAGAKSQMTSIMLAGIVLLTLAFLAPAFQWLPEAALAAIVINAMSGSANPRELRIIWRIDRVDFVFGLATLLVVLVFDLLPAMVTGIVLSIVYMVYRVSFPARSVLQPSRRDQAPGGSGHPPRWTSDDRAASPRGLGSIQEPEVWRVADGFWP